MEQRLPMLSSIGGCHGQNQPWRKEVAPVLRLSQNTDGGQTIESAEMGGGGERVAF